MRTVLWFRKGLRLHDNPALSVALSGTPSAFLAVFVLDPWFADPARIVANRYNYLLESLRDLDSSLRARGSRLVVLRGSVSEVLPAALSRWRAGRLVFEDDIEPYARARDAKVSADARAAGIAVIAVPGHTLWSPADLLKKAGSTSKLPSTYDAFCKLARSLPEPPRPVPAPASLPAAGDADALFPDVAGGVNAVPGLIELGFDPAAVTTFFRGAGGETRARAALAALLQRASFIERFDKPSSNPTAVDAPSTTALSPALKFGTLGAREMWWGVADACAAARAAGRPVTEPPTSLAGQLLWREFFYAQGATIPNFDRMEGNRAARAVAWDYDDAALRRWELGRTGFPWIDACMAQLRADGWLHHLARHCVACFLTRGDLYQSWEHGARVFDRYLVDSDWALNNGNWLWLSGSSVYFTSYFRVYSPVAFAKKYDATGAYVRRWLPALARMPARYIYEPWTAPRAVQEAAGCVVGRDYPQPMLDHAAACKANMERLGAAYAAARAGAGAGAAAAAAAAAAPPPSLTPARGAGQTQMGSDEGQARAWAAAVGVALGDIPAKPSGGGASASAAAAAAATATGAEPAGDFAAADFSADKTDVEAAAPGAKRPRAAAPAAKAGGRAKAGKAVGQAKLPF